MGRCRAQDFPEAGSAFLLLVHRKPGALWHKSLRRVKVPGGCVLCAWEDGCGAHFLYGKERSWHLEITELTT